MTVRINNIKINSFKNNLSFKGFYKKKYEEQAKYSKNPNVVKSLIVDDKNIKSLLNSLSVTMADISMIINDIGKITQEYSLDEIMEAIRNPDTYKFVSDYKLRLVQAPLAAKLSDSQKQAFKNALLELNNPKLEETLILKMLKSDEYLVIAETQEVYDSEFANNIYFQIKVTPDGDFQITRLENDCVNYTSSRLKNSDISTIIRTKDADMSEYIAQITEIKPDCIINSIISDKLDGVYEITRYDFSNYPLDIDLLSEIQHGKLEGGAAISRVEEDEDFLKYSDKYGNEGIVSKRYYKRAKDGTCKELQYEISRGDDKLLDIKRRWCKISPDITITILNDKKYIADFSNPKKIEITDDKGSVYSVNISRIAPKLNREFLKTLDAVTLINIEKSCKKIIPVESRDESHFDSMKETIYATEDEFVLLHELGHAIDTSQYYSDPNFINREKGMYKIYCEEFENFNKTHDSNMQKVIEYFSQISLSNGMDEVVAEVNALLTTFSNNCADLSARDLLLVQYFPKTISYAAKLLGYGA